MEEGEAAAANTKEAEAVWEERAGVPPMAPLVPPHEHGRAVDAERARRFARAMEAMHVAPNAAAAGAGWWTLAAGNARRTDERARHGDGSANPTDAELDRILWQPWHQRNLPAADVAAQANPDTPKLARDPQVSAERANQGVELRSAQQTANFKSTTPYLKSGLYATLFAPPIQFAPLAPAPPPPNAPPPFGRSTYVSATALRLNPFLLFPFAPPPFEPYMNEPCFGGIAKDEGGLICPGFPRIPNENYLYRRAGPLTGVDFALIRDGLVQRPEELRGNSFYYPGLLRAAPPLAPREASWQRPTYSGFSPALLGTALSESFYVNIGFTPRKGLGSIGNEGKGFGVVPSYGLVT